MKTLEELETIAKDRFILNSDWNQVLDMLDSEEKELYDKLFNARG